MLAVNGLFGHIQRNNFKSTALIVSFVLLFLIMQLAFRLIPMAASMQLSAEFDRVIVSMGGTHGGGGVSTNRLPAISSRLRNDIEAIEPRRPDVALKPMITPVAAARYPDNPTLIDAFWKYFETSDFFTRQWLMLLGVAGVWLFVATWWNSLFIRYAMRARPLERRECPELYNLVENVAINAGLPCPAIELVDTPSLNAYASGLSAKTARLGLTTGLIGLLSRDELEAVIAHEISHIRNGDCRLMAVLKACVDLVLPAAGAVVGWFRRRPVLAGALMAMIWMRLGTSTMISFALVIGLVFLATKLAEMLVCHSREFVADAQAVELTKNPAALIRALKKIAGKDDIAVPDLTARAIMFSGSSRRLFATHPPVEARIEAITAHARVGDHEVAAAVRAPVDLLRRPKARYRPAAGSEGRRAGVPAALQDAAARARVAPAEGGELVRKGWAETWIVSGRLDAIAGWTMYLLSIPFRLVIYLMAAGMVYMLVIFLLLGGLVG